MEIAWRAGGGVYVNSAGTHIVRVEPAADPSRAQATLTKLRQPEPEIEPEPERCDECGEPIPAFAPNMVNPAHKESCSLHPSATVDPDHGLEIARMLICSTAHLTKIEAKGLEIGGYSRGEYGFLLYVGSELDPVPEIPLKSDGLVGAMQTARDAGCVYLLLDRDGEKIANVPTYEW